MAAFAHARRTGDVGNPASLDHECPRRNEARQLGDALTRTAVEQLAAEIDGGNDGVVVVNPTSAERTSTVLLHAADGDEPVHYVTHDGTACLTQELATVGGDGFSTVVVGQKIRWVLDLMRGTEFAGRQVTSYDIVENAGAGDDRFDDIVLQEAGPGDARIDLAELKASLLQRGGAGRSMRLRLLVAPQRRLLFDTGPVDGFGWATFTPVNAPAPAGPVVATDGAVTVATPKWRSPGLGRKTRPAATCTRNGKAIASRSAPPRVATTVGPRSSGGGRRP